VLIGRRPRARQARPDFADHHDVRIRGHQVKGDDLDDVLAAADANELWFRAINGRIAVCSSAMPGLYAGVVHRIKPTAGFKPRRMRAYRVPDLFTPDARKQIEAHPTICQSDGPSDRCAAKRMASFAACQTDVARW